MPLRKTYWKRNPEIILEMQFRKASLKCNREKRIRNTIKKNIEEMQLKKKKHFENAI